MNKIIKTKITNIGDPFILPYKGTYYHYSTSFAKGFKVFTSKDLKNWEDKGLCYKDSKFGYMDFWAPEVYYHNNQFYMFFSSKNIEQDRLMISVAISDSPLGPFKDVKLFDFGYAAIDASIYMDDDNRKYMYYAKDCSENVVNGINTSQIFVVELTNDLLNTIGEPKLVLTPSTPHEQRQTDWQWNEGPFMLKHDGIYYLSYSTNFFASKEYSVSYATSKNPFGPFTKAKENPILSYIDGVISGPGHNAYFKTFDGDLMTSYHIHTDIDNPSGNRTTCFSKYHFENDKLIIDYL